MRRGLVATIAVLALVLGACGNSGDDDDSATADTTAESGDTTTDGTGGTDELVPVDAPGVSDEEISVGVITSKTNPLGGKYAQLADGINAYFAKVNSEGGIYGRQLVIGKERDDQLAKNQQEVQAMLSQDDVFAAFIATLLFTGAPDLQEAGMPTFGWNINPEWSDRDALFGHLGALCFGCLGKPIPWLAQEIGATKVGVLGYGVSEQSKVCAEGYQTSFDEYKTAEIVFFDDSIPFGVTDLSAQVAKMKDAAVDMIVTCMDLNGVFTLAKEMDKQGLDAVQHLPNGYDQEFMKANGEFFEGDYVSPQFTAFEHDPKIPEIDDFFSWMEETGKTPVELSAVGWIAAYQFVKGLELAGPDFDQQKVIDALNQETAVSANGFNAPIDWTKQHVNPVDNPDVQSDTQCANFVQVQDGELVSVLGEPGKPWVCFPNDTGPLGDPEYVSFAPEE